jgi:hypothetical protein
LLLALLWMALVPWPAQANSAPALSLSAAVLSPARVVPLSDGTWRAVYELVLTNTGAAAFAVGEVEVRDAGWPDVIVSRLGHAHVAGSLLLPDGRKGGTLAAAESALLLFEVPFADRGSIPAEIEHRFVLRPAAPKSPAQAFDKLAKTALDRRSPLVIGAPLRGSPWVAQGSCCESYHRRALLPVDGQLYAAQRYAVDWIRIDEGERLAAGDTTRNSSYPGFGAEVLAVADATVIRVTNGQPDQPPGNASGNAHAPGAEGNSVVIDLGDGHFALYAHLQKDSIQVREGDRITRGQVIAKVGNSGHSGAPHLHFQVMDRPHPYAANGLPWVIDSFERYGSVQSKDDLKSELRSPQLPARVNLLPAPVRHVDQLPANLLIVGFSSGE